MTPRVDPYSRIAAFYDAEFEDAEVDVRTYTRALEGSSRVLVLGCGTGRVSEGLRAGGRDVVAVDLSGPMIERARARERRRGQERLPGVRYLVGDMCELSQVGASGFDAAVIPNAAFSFLPTRRDQLRCLAGLRARVHGPVWIDVPMPDFALLGSPHSPEAPAWEGVVEGSRIQRTREVWRRPVQQQLVLLDRYYGSACDGPALLHTSELRLRLVFPGELEWLLEAAGFYADAMFGDHAGGPVREGCDRLLVRAM